MTVEQRADCCVVCFEAVATAADGIRCTAGDGHVVCNECFETVVNHRCDAASEVEIGSLSEAAKKTAFRVQCPCSGRSEHLSCDSAPYSDQAVAMHVSSRAYERYMDMRAMLKIHKAEAAAFEEAQEALHDEMEKLRLNPEKTSEVGTVLLGRQLKKLMPHARQCPSCSWGPMDFRACSDLKAHHGQVKKVISDPFGIGDDGAEPFEIKIDNSCPKCGFFSAKRKAWPKWDGQVHNEELATPLEAFDKAAKKYMPRIKQAESRRDEAEEAEKQARALYEAKVAELEAETLRRRQAEADYLNMRASISTTERTYASAGARVMAQLERERELRRRAEQRMIFTSEPPAPPPPLLCGSATGTGTGGYCAMMAEAVPGGTVRSVLSSARGETARGEAARLEGGEALLRGRRALPTKLEPLVVSIPSDRADEAAAAGGREGGLEHVEACTEWLRGQTPP